MNKSTPSLDLNLSYQHYRDGQKPLHVVLRATPLAGLIEDAKCAYRVYELFCILRPGDIWKYLHVHPVSVAPDVAPRIADARGRAIERMRDKFLVDQLGAHSFDRDIHWLTDAIPFPEFDSAFVRAWDDTEPPDECWRSAAESDAVRAFCRGCFDWAKRTQHSLRNSHDLLIGHEISLLDATEHVHDWTADVPWLPTPPDYAPTIAPTFSWTYYTRLTELVARPDVAAISYVGRPDFHTLRILFAEQRRRAVGRGKPSGPQQNLSILAFTTCDCSAWGGHARWQLEGIGYGNLRIVDQAGLAGPMDESGDPHNNIGRWILSPDDLGDVTGFTRCAGSELSLYERSTPTERDPAVSEALER